ncbi:N-acetyltransferase [Sphingopyxis sp. XHP0097]|uniref:N-acetyltransferase n=1 Tax=Sphingopyxis jiangsuensis TaxID=2871171 RepID=A0ABS7MB47_9SPHN|nr:N-acetyltransferase [Sphingopyxis jiangsuensis]MBY4635899.1 N-acetyltransferase [Sphingopyxis jiangsuensis]
MPDELLIRSASKADAEDIDLLVRAAFAQTEFGHQGEAELVRMLSDDGDALVSLVAESGSALVGHVLFSRMDVEADGAALSAAGLAPVSVVRARQGAGIGAALINAGLDALRQQGIAMSFVQGHVDYYRRFGYSIDLADRFASPFSGPHFMAMMLDSNAEWPQGGRADYAPAFGRLG